MHQHVNRNITHTHTHTEMRAHKHNMRGNASYKPQRCKHEPHRWKNGFVKGPARVQTRSGSCVIKRISARSSLSDSAGGGGSGALTSWRLSHGTSLGPHRCRRQIGAAFEASHSSSSSAPEAHLGGAENLQNVRSAWVTLKNLIRKAKTLSDGENSNETITWAESHLSQTPTSFR